MIKLFVFISSVTLSLAAFAAPSLKQVDMFFGALNAEPENYVTHNEDYDFEGIVGLSNCSASLVRFKNDTNMNRKAMVMTNGHCIGLGSARFGMSKMPAMGEVLTDIAVEKTMSLFGSKSTPIGKLTATKLLYGTMTDTDFALYEVKRTYQEIKDEFNVDALVMADQKPVPGSAIEIISGYWKLGYACRMDSEIYRLKEDQWTWKNSIKYTDDGCKTKGGTSGSPIISALTREVVGINNTGNNNDGPECSIMNPCEVDENGEVTDDDKRSYGQQTYWIYSCLSKDFKINLRKPGCKLPK